MFAIFSLTQKTFFNNKNVPIFELATLFPTEHPSIPPFDGKFLSIYQNSPNELYLQIRAFTRDLSRSLSHLPWEYTRRVQTLNKRVSAARLLPKRKWTSRRAFQPGYRRFRYLSVFIKESHVIVGLVETLSFVPSCETHEPIRFLSVSTDRV